MMRFIKLALAGVCVLGLVAAGTTANAAPVKIRMSGVAPLANWASIILYKKDLMHNLGKSYTLETVHFRGTPPMITAVANNEFIKAHRAAMVDFMTDLLRVVHWYLDPKNHAAVEEIASKLTKAPASRFGWVFTKQDNYRDPNMVPDLEALQRNVDTVQQLGSSRSPSTSSSIQT